MAEFVVLLRTGEFFDRKYGPEDFGEMGRKYTEWFGAQAEAGRLKVSLQLKAGEGRTLTGFGDEVTVNEDAYGLVPDVINGVFSIEVADYDEAVAVTRSCPHLEYGGILEIRAAQ